jgi:hypothetical protein
MDLDHLLGLPFPSHDAQLVEELGESLLQERSR